MPTVNKYGHMFLHNKHHYTSGRRYYSAYQFDTVSMEFGGLLAKIFAYNSLYDENKIAAYVWKGNRIRPDCTCMEFKGFLAF